MAPQKLAEVLVHATLCSMSSCPKRLFAFGAILTSYLLCHKPVQKQRRAKLLQDRYDVKNLDDDKIKHYQTLGSQIEDVQDEIDYLEAKEQGLDPESNDPKMRARVEVSILLPLCSCR